jgi:hypothetical protein
VKEGRERQICLKQAPEVFRSVDQERKDCAARGGFRLVTFVVAKIKRASRYKPLQSWAEDAGPS